MALIVRGNKVKVSNGGKLKERIFLFKNELDDEVVCVHKEDEAKYLAGENFRVGLWTEYETLEYGDTVSVSNGGVVFKDRIYLGKVGSKILCVHNEDLEKFEDGALNFRTALWNRMK